MDIQHLLQKNFEVKPNVNERNELVQEVNNFLNFAQTAHFLKPLPNALIRDLLKKAKKEGDNPRAFFKYLVKQEVDKLK